MAYSSRQQGGHSINGANAGLCIGADQHNDRMLEKAGKDQQGASDPNENLVLEE